MDEQVLPSERMQEKIKNYIECRRWLVWGPLGSQLNNTEKDYILFMGAYENNPHIRLCIGALEKIFHDSPSSVSSTLKMMQKKGLVEVSQRDDHKRGKDVKLSENGRVAYERLCSYLESNIRDNAVDDPNQGYPIIGFLGT